AGCIIFRTAPAPGSNEDTANSREFFHDIRRRGLPDPLLVVSHGALSMIRAIARIEPVLALHLILLSVNVIRLIEARPITLPASLAKVSQQPDDIALFTDLLGQPPR